MAAIDKIYVTELTEQTRSETTYASAMTVDSTEFVANAVYMCWVWSQIAVDNNGRPGKVRWTEGPTQTLIQGSEEFLEYSGPSENTMRAMYFAQFKYTAPAIPVDLNYEHAVTNAVDTIFSDTIVFKAIRLDVGLVENTDWFYVENDDIASPVPLTTSWVDFVPKTFTPGNNNDEWGVIGFAGIDVNSTGISFNARIRRDGTAGAPIEAGMFYQGEGEDAGNAEVLPIPLLNVFTLSNAPHTIAVSCQDDAAGTQNDHRFSTLFILRLNAFEDHGFSVNTVFDPVGTDWEEFPNPLDVFTPTTDPGEFSIFAAGALDVGAAPNNAIVRIQIGGTTNPTGSDVYLGDIDPTDPTDERVSVKIISVNLSGSTDIDFYGRTEDSGADPIWRHNGIFYFSHELAIPDGAGLPPYGQVIFNSADEENRPRYGQRIARGTEE